MEVQRTTIRTKADIVTALKRTFEAVQQRIAALTENSYLKKSGIRWSPAEPLEHLILSTIPIVGALGKDRDWFAQFGAADHPQMDYEALKH